MQGKRKTRIPHSIDRNVIEENLNNTKYNEQDKETIKEFTSRLNDLFEKENVKQCQLAEELGISTGVISDYRNGKKYPQEEILRKIANKFKVSTDYLLGKTELQSTDKNYKMIYDFTGLTDDAIFNLHDNKKMIEKNLGSKCHSDDYFKQSLKAINYLISNENETQIFYNIAVFLWKQYKTLEPDVLKELKKANPTQEELESLNMLFENKIEILDELNVRHYLSVEDLSSISIIHIQNELNKLKEKISEEQK